MSETYVSHTKPWSRMQSLSESRGGSKVTKPIFSNSIKRYWAEVTEGAWHNSTRASFWISSSLNQLKGDSAHTDTVYFWKYTYYQCDTTGRREGSHGLSGGDLIRNICLFNSLLILFSITAVSGFEVVRRLPRCKMFQNKVMFPLKITAGMLISDDSLLSHQ